MRKRIGKKHLKARCNKEEFAAYYLTKKAREEGSTRPQKARRVWLRLRDKLGAPSFGEKLSGGGHRHRRRAALVVRRPRDELHEHHTQIDEGKGAKKQEKGDGDHHPSCRHGYKKREKDKKRC